MAITLRFVGANPDVRLEGQREGTAKVNYLIGNDPARWHTGLPTYREVLYRELWPGVDLVFRQARGQLKYEFVLKPGARVEAIRLAYRGAEGLALDEAGNLQIRTPLGVLTDQRPTSHQEIQGRRVPVESRFAPAPDGAEPNAFGFAVGAAYNPRYPLTIDPGLGYLALVGGTSADFGNAIVMDGSGFAYITGETDSADFPTTAGAFDRSFAGGSKVHGISDAFVAKFDPNGVLVWATYLGGTDADVGLGIAILPGCIVDCNPYVTGFTYSGDFPVFPNPGAFRIKITGGADAFVTQLKANGSGLVYSTFLGGGGFDAGHAIALDPPGNAYITGETLSSNFPITPFAVFASSQGKRDAFVTKLNAGGSALVYSTYLGGNGNDVGFGIAVACLDPSDSTKCNAFVTGQTDSVNFPTTLSFPTRVTASIDTSLNGPTDAFVAKLRDDGSLLLYSTFLGGSGDEAGFGIAIDGVGNAYVTGQTNSINFPATPGAFQTALNLNAGVATVDAFVTKVNAAGSGLVYSTFLGGSGDDVGTGITLACVDPADPTKCSAIVTGQTTSSNYPTTSTAGAFNASYGGNTDAFVTKLKVDGSGLFYSTFLGGSGTDSGHGIACASPTDCTNVYVTGQTNSPSDATFLPTFGQLNLGGLANTNPDAFVAKLDVRASTSTAISSSANPSVFGQSVTFTATVTSPVGTPTGPVTFKDGTTTLGTGTLNASGQATFTTSSLTVGTHSITAVYGGDGNFLTSTSPALTQTVNKADTTTAVASSANPSVFGQSVTFTATVSVAPPLGVLLPGAGTPSGTVTFREGATVLAANVSLNASGQATFTTSALAVGSHPITADYNGSASFNTSSGSVAQVVNKADTTTTVVSSVHPSVFGQPVTFTATVTVNPPGSTAVTGPTGTVTFKDGGVAIGSGTVNASGQATFSPPSLSVASHSITADYGGDGSFNGSTSGALTQVVNKADTTTGVVTSKTPTVFSEPVTFTAMVSVLPPGAGTPSGSVQFFDGAFSLGTAPLVGLSASLTTSALNAGLHSITAKYLGDTNFNNSASPILSQTVNKAFTTTAVPTSSLNPSKFGQSVTFTTTVAVVSPGTATPTGTATFKDAGVAIGTGTLAAGQAIFTTSGLGVGFHSITAAYNESDNFFGSASAELGQTVISAPTVTSTDRTFTVNNALFANCKSQVVNITGTSFLPPPGLVVAFSGSGITVADVMYKSSTAISATVDVAAGTVGLQTVSVTNADGGSATGPGFVDVPNANSCPAGVGLAPSKTATATSPPPPSITSLTPNSGLLGNSTTISGSNFGATPADNTVTFAGAGNTRVPATVNTAASTSLAVTVPANAIDGPVTVSVGGLLSNGVNFTVTNPRLSNVFPSSGVQGSTIPTVDLTGTKFASLPTVAFSPATGIIVGAVIFIDSTHIQVSITIDPAAPTGLRSVTVTNPAAAGGGSSTLAGAFEVKPPVTNALALSVPSLSTYLPSVDAVSVTLDATGKCTAKTVTPTAVALAANFTTTVGALQPASVTFTITSSTTSAIPGTAINEDCEPGLAPTKDFSIGVADPTWGTSQQVTVLDSGGGVYTTTLYSFDWGGTVRIDVTGLANGVTTVSGSLTLPLDVDKDLLPDAYETDAALNANAVGANVLDRLNPDQNGNGTPDGNDRFTLDGLSNFEKYRGAYLVGPANGGTGVMSGHIRLGAGKRHLFVQGRGFGNDPAITAGFCGIDPSTGSPVADTNPCPPFEVGGAYAERGIQVHDVSASFTGSTVLPRQSLANPANPTLDMATVVYDGVNCGSAAGCSTSKIGVRQWEFSTLGLSAFGTATAYGSDSRVFKKAVDAYFSDRPYLHRTNVPQCGPGVIGPCFEPGPTLTPITLVGDTNDNGIRDTNKEAVGSDGQLASDTYGGGPLTFTLSAMDVNNDGCVELPFVSDPTTLAPCNPTLASATSPQATKRQVVRSLINHELGHAVGVNLHTTDSTDLMYQYTINWIRDGHFSQTAADLLQIHNKGLQ